MIFCPCLLGLIRFSKVVNSAIDKETVICYAKMLVCAASSLNFIVFNFKEKAVRAYLGFPPKNHWERVGLLIRLVHQVPGKRGNGYPEAIFDD